MTISTIISNAAPAGSLRSGRTEGERRGTVDTEEANRDRVSVSGRAQALYSADAVAEAGCDPGTGASGVLSGRLHHGAGC